MKNIYLGIRGCEDEIPAEVCNKWVEKGFCSKPWAAAKCPKSCDACEDEENVCEDIFLQKHCENILDKGLCTKPFLASKCPKTCGTCEDDGIYMFIDKNMYHRKRSQSFT